VCGGRGDHPYCTSFGEKFKIISEKEKGVRFYRSMSQRGEKNSFGKGKKKKKGTRSQGSGKGAECPPPTSKRKACQGGGKWCPVREKEVPVIPRGGKSKGEKKKGRTSSSRKGKIKGL